MRELFILYADVIGPDRVIENGAVLVRQGRIAQVFEAPPDIPDDADIVDAHGMTLAPGFIDLHIHGSGDYLIDNGPDDLAGLSKWLPRTGTTAFLPTVCPLPPGEDAAFVASLARVAPRGASFLGLHLEGPFLTLTGALPPEALGRADPDRVRALIEACAPLPAIFSVAPDFEDIEPLLPIMAQGGRPVFMTHTQADAEQTQRAVDAGVRHATHFYDVFYAPPETDIGKRPCGAVEVALADPRVTVDFILDGEHVEPVAVRAALAAKGKEGVCLITDANLGAGAAPGVYQFGKHAIEFAYPGAPARFTDAHPEYPGALAGSGLRMDQAVRNAVDMLGLDLADAVRMASTNPARVLGVHDQKGAIAPNYDADLVLLDADARPVRTWVGGRLVWSVDDD